MTTHSRLLADQIAVRCQTEPIELALVEGETRLASEKGTPRRPYAVDDRRESEDYAARG